MMRARATVTARKTDRQTDRQTEIIEHTKQNKTCTINKMNQTIRIITSERGVGSRS